MLRVGLCLVAMAVLAAALEAVPDQESTWTPVSESGGTAMLAVMDHAAVAALQDYMYVFGGFFTDGSPTDTVQTFHFVTHEADTPDFGDIGPLPRGGHCMVSVSDHEALVFGGSNATSITGSPYKKMYYNDLWLMDMQAGTWRQITPPANTVLPTERAHMGCAMVGNQLYVWGGETVDADTDEALLLDDMWAIDITTGSGWQSDIQGTGVRPDKRYGHALVRLGEDSNDHRLALWGGMYTSPLGDQYIRADGMWYFSLKSHSWSWQGPQEPGFRQSQGLPSRAFMATMHIGDGVVDTIIASGGYGQAAYNGTTHDYYDDGLPDMSVNVVWGATSQSERMSTGYYETHVRGAPGLQKHVMVMDPSDAREAYTYMYGGQEPNGAGPSNVVYQIQWFRDVFDKCSLYDRCETCTASLDCGFCGAATEGASAFCAAGDSSGFTDAKKTCDEAGAYSYDHCPECVHLSCASCAALPQCGWCALRGDHAAGVCTPGVKEGPINFHECDDEWLYARDECPFTTPKVKGGVVAGVILSTLASAAIVAAFFRFRHKF